MANSNKKKTHCPKGHPLAKGNLVLSALKLGKRSCLTCRRIGDKKRRNPNGNISPAVLNSQKKFCKKGHELSGDNLNKSALKLGKRSCKTCINERGIIKGQTPESKSYKRNWTSNNRDKSRGYSKKWSVNNPEKAKQWDKDHPEQVKQRQRKHNQSPRRIAAIKKWQKEDYEKNPEKTLQRNMRQLEKVGKPLGKSSIEYNNALQALSKTVKKQAKCAICGIEIDLKAHHIFYKSSYPKMSLNMNNVIVLCQQHHYEVHGKKLKSKNKKESIREI